MLEAVRTEHPDQIIHLGDIQPDIRCLQKVFPDIPITSVPGNCDGFTRGETTVEREWDGVRVLLGHGHQWNVKAGPERAVREAESAGAQVLLFGHTHRALCRKEGNLWIMNPGTVGGDRAEPSYGLLNTDGQTVCQVKWFGSGNE